MTSGSGRNHSYSSSNTYGGHDGRGSYHQRSSQTKPPKPRAETTGPRDMHRTVHNDHSVNSNFGNSVSVDNSGQSHVTNNYRGAVNDNRSYTAADERHYFNAHPTASRGRGRGAGYHPDATYHDPHYPHYAAPDSTSRGRGSVYPGQGENRSRPSSDAFTHHDPPYSGSANTSRGGGSGYPGQGEHRSSSDFTYHESPYSGSPNTSRGGSSGYRGPGENQLRPSSDAFSSSEGPPNARFAEPRYPSQHSTNHRGYSGPVHHGDPRHRPMDQPWFDGHAQLYAEPESHGESNEGERWEHQPGYEQTYPPTNYGSMPPPSNNPYTVYNNGQPRTSNNPFATM